MHTLHLEILYVYSKQTFNIFRTNRAERLNVDYCLHPVFVSFLSEPGGRLGPDDNFLKRNMQLGVILMKGLLISLLLPLVI